MKKLLLVLLTSFVLVLSAQTPKVALKFCDSSVLNEFVYIQTDRPFYEPDDSVWLSVWVVDDKKHEISNLSLFIKVEVSDPVGNVIFKQTINRKLDENTMVFKLKEGGGMYEIVAYTDYTNRIDSNFRAKKTIQVQHVQNVPILFDFVMNKNSYLNSDSILVEATVKNQEGTILKNQLIAIELFLNGDLWHTDSLFTNHEGKIFYKNQFNISSAIYFASLQFKTEYGGAIGSKYKNIPFSSSIKDLQFLPESGYLINGISSLVAFKALDVFGKPVSVKGSVFNHLHTKMTDFESEHDGMGKFKFLPELNQFYYALVSLPNNIKDTFYLPEALDSGIIISVLRQNQKSVDFELLSNMEGPKFVVLRKGNTIVYEKVLMHASKFSIITENLSMGVYEISTFNKNWQPMCSRLLFINPHKKVNVSIELDKTEYALREKVNVKIKTMDENNQAIKTRFSLSVVNEQAYQYTEKNEGNILSALFLEQELKGPIHLPAYYFEKKDSQVFAHLDLLMLTNGWRRIEFQDIIEKSTDLVEKYLNAKNPQYVVFGYIYDNSQSIKDFSKFRIKILNNGQFVNLEKNGSFFIYGFSNHETVDIKVKIPGYHFKFSVKPWLISEDLRKFPNAKRYLLENDFNLANSDKSSSKLTAYHHLKKEDLMVLNSKSINQSDVLNAISKSNQTKAKFLSGVTNTRGGLSGRGSRIDGTAVFVDGVRVNNSSKIESTQMGVFCSSVSIAYYGSSSRGDFNYYNYRYHYDYEFNYNPMVFRKNDLHEIKDNPKYQFYSPKYLSTKYVLNGDDKDTRTTLFYAFNVSTNDSGIAAFSFNNSDENGSFKCVVEGVGSKSYLAHGVKSYSVKKLLIVNLNVPEYLTKGDVLKLPLSILNNQKKQKIMVFLKSKSNNARFDYLLDSGESFTQFITLSENFEDRLDFRLDIQSETYQEVLKYSINLKEQFKNRSFVMSGIKQEQTANFYLEQLSTPFEYVKLEATIGNNMVYNILNTLEGMIREPYGCFEQVSSVNFPNILAYQILQSKNMFKDNQQKTNYLNILNNGYAKLAAYETNQHGFEWYGRTPPHEGLSAYGLIQFYELKKIGIKVDESMLKRTQDWLIARFNIDGSIKVNAGKYGFSGASVLVTTTYVTWVLSQYTTIDLSKQIKYIEAEYDKKFDAYIAALLTQIYANKNELVKAKVLNSNLLFHLKNQNYQNINADHSIVRSGKKSLDIEVISIAIINAIKLKFYNEQIDEMVNALFSKRNSNMYFGNTQATVWALSALKDWSMMNEFNEEQSCYAKIYVNQNLVFEDAIHTSTDILSIDLMKTSRLKQGNNEIRIEFSVDKKFNYTIKAEWLSRFSTEQTEKLSVETSSVKKNIKNGDFYQMDITLKNKMNEGQAQTVCIIPIPACMTLIPEQLKLLSDKKYFDFYEIKNNELILYFAELAPKDVKKIPIAFQVNNTGDFLMPNINAYLYYNPSEKYHVENIAFKID